MNRVLINLSIPSINANYEIFILENKPMFEIREMILEGVNGLLGDCPIAIAELTLCNQESASIINLDHTVKENGIVDGTRLILF